MRCPPVGRGAPLCETGRYPGAEGANRRRSTCGGAVGRERRAPRPRRPRSPALQATPIADYALLSDCQGAALVARDGSIDWWCAPRFDSRSLFARLLDPAAGHWVIAPEDRAQVTRRYLPGTMVLETTLATAQGTVRLRDALALEAGARGHDIGRRVPHALVRVLDGVEGAVKMTMECAPRPEYGLVVPDIIRVADAVVTTGGPDRLTLHADVPVEIDRSRIVMRRTVTAGQRIGFALVRASPWAGDEVVDPAASIDDAAEAWLSWSGQHTGYRGYSRELVARSALVLQGLTHAPTGAIIAAPTTSLPEIVGGELNWDYRFAWLRDASLTLQALWVAACPDEALRNFDWIARAAVGAAADDDLQIVFGVGCERDLSEHELGHLRGYRDSAPVRIGNAAWRQTQLDVPGEILASAHLLRERLGELDEPMRTFLASVADIAAARWRDPDSGIWEGREGLRHYLSSKVMCWVALDRALDMADALGADAERRIRWRAERDEVRRAVLREGWHEETGAYTGAFGSDHLDASVLLMPLVGFLPADDPRMRQTIDLIERELSRDGLVLRWTAAEDGAFLTCSFWLADCLARAGEVARARAVFERAAAHANDLGLMSEQVDMDTGELIGNFPQGLSHVGLIGAAWSIDGALRS